MQFSNGVCLSVCLTVCCPSVCPSEAYLLRNGMWCRPKLGMTVMFKIRARFRRKKFKNHKNLIFCEFIKFWSGRLEYYRLYFLDFFNHKEQQFLDTGESNLKISKISKSKIFNLKISKIRSKCQLCIFHDYLEILSWATGVCQHQGPTSARHGPNISHHWAYCVEITTFWGNSCMR